jgi:hypothetical protein
MDAQWIVDALAATDTLMIFTELLENLVPGRVGDPLEYYSHTLMGTRS